MEFLQAMHLYSAVYICRRGVRPRDSTFCVGVLLVGIDRIVIITKTDQDKLV